MIAVVSNTYKVNSLISYLCSQFHCECIQTDTISHIADISLP